MTTILFEINTTVSLGSISNEEDLKLSPRMNINPPPSRENCYCCGRHISELKPFGGPGDPLVGDFTGKVLVKTWRPNVPYSAEAFEAYEEAKRWYLIDGFEGELDWMIDKHGKKRAEEFYFSVMAYGATGSWECRDCIVLDTDEYFEKMEQRNK